MGGSFGGRRNDTNNQSGDMTPPDNSNMQNPPDGNAPSGNPPTMQGQDAADSTTTDDTTDKQPVLAVGIDAVVRRGYIQFTACQRNLIRFQTLIGGQHGDFAVQHGQGKRRMSGQSDDDFRWVDYD